MTCNETTTWSSEFGVATWGGITTSPPRPPASYTAPSPTGSVVTTYAELAAEMALAGPRVIVVADGVYSGAGLTTNQGHEVWAENMGSATLEFGLGFRGNSGNVGGAVHGFVFDVDNIANVDGTALQNEAIINTWDSLAPYDVGSSLLIEDCTFNGNDVVGSAIQATSPSGLTVRRCVIENFIDNGVFAYRNGSGPDDFDLMTFEDLDISNVARPVPGSAGGVNAEAGLYIGHRFVARRIRIRDVAWTGIALVNEVNDWSIEDGDFDNIGWGLFEAGSVGVYCEESHDGVICRSIFGPNIKVGVNCEWNGGDTDPYENDYVARNHSITIQNCTFNTYKMGVHFDVTVQDCLVQNCHFTRSWLAAVLDNNEFPDATGDFEPPDGVSPIESTNTFDEASCTFCLHPDVPTILHDHHGGAALAPTIEGWALTAAEVDESLLFCYGAALSGIVDLAGNPMLSFSRVQCLGFESEISEFRTNKIYDAHIQSLRDEDFASGLFWKRFCEGPEKIREQAVSRILELKTLANANLIEDEHLPLLALTYGWDQTSKVEILNNIDPLKLRAAISQSHALWDRRGAGGAVVEAMNLLVGVRAFEFDWFDNRWLLQEQHLSENVSFMSEESRMESQIVLVDPDRELPEELLTKIAQKWRPLGERFILTWAEFYDDFSDETQGWQAQTGSFSIADGVMSIPGTGSARVAIPDSANHLRDVKIEADLEFLGTAEFGISARSSAVGSGVEALVSGLGTARLLVDGVEQSSVDLESLDIEFNAGYPANLRLLVSGNFIELFVNGEKALEASAATSDEAGLCSIQANAGASLEVQTFKILPCPGKNIYVGINGETRSFPST